MTTKTRSGARVAKARKVHRDEPLLTELLRLLDEAQGLHTRLARETGVAQAVVSRTFLRDGEPRLTSADAMLQWLRANRSRFEEMRIESAVQRVAKLTGRRVKVKHPASEATRSRLAAFDPRAGSR